VATGLWQKTDVIKRIPLRAAINIKVPTDKQVRQMERLYDRMELLAAPAKRQVAAKKLSLFGYQGPEAAAAGIGNTEPQGLEESRFHLSLVVLAGLNNYCIVDGNFMAEGARMDDGTQVLKIESHRVLIARNHERKWIYLQSETTSSAVPDEKDTTDPQKGQS
jgi:hypothetical protein